MSGKKYPRVGIGVMLKKGNAVLLGLRKNSHGSDSWCFPGGYQEFGETMEACARRELKEETGLEVNKLELISIADEMDYIKSDDKHYVNIGFLANYVSGQPQIMETDKCAEWKWFDLNALPTNMLQGTNLILHNYFKNIACTKDR